MRLSRGKRLVALTALAFGLTGFGAAQAGLIDIDVSDNEVSVPVLKESEFLNDNEILSDLDILEDIIEDSEVLNDNDLDVLEDIVEDSDVDVLEDIVEDSSILEEVDVFAVVAALLEIL
jgi:hypothetical protein